MKEKKVVCKFTVKAKIYDVELPEKIKKELVEKLPSINPEIYYEIKVAFDRSVYSKSELYHYPLEKEFILAAQSQTETEKRDGIRESILNQQINNIVKQVETLGLSISSAGIIGKDLTNAQNIEVQVKERYLKTEAPKPFLKAFSIAPEHPLLNESIAKAFAELLLEQMTKEKMRELEIANHTPNMINAEELFYAVARETLCDGKCADETEIKELADKLRIKAVIKSDFPLEIEAGTREQIKENPLESDTKIDCPEYLLYHSYTGGYWTLNKAENLKAAQQIITKRGYNLKATAAIIVLHNLEAVPFSLFEETDEGLVLLEKESAHGKKKLHLSWNK